MSSALIAWLYLALAVVFACIALYTRKAKVVVITMVSAIVGMHAMPYDDNHPQSYLAALVLACLVGAVASFAIVPRRIHH